MTKVRKETEGEWEVQLAPTYLERLCYNTKSTPNKKR